MSDGAGGGGGAEAQEDLMTQVALFRVDALHRESALFQHPPHPTTDPARDADQDVFVGRKRGKTNSPSSAFA